MTIGRILKVPKCVGITLGGIIGLLVAVLEEDLVPGRIIDHEAPAEEVSSRVQPENIGDVWSISPRSSSDAMVSTFRAEMFRVSPMRHLHQT